MCNPETKRSCSTQRHKRITDSNCHSSAFQRDQKQHEAFMKTLEHAGKLSLVVLFQQPEPIEQETATVAQICANDEKIRRITDT